MNETFPLASSPMPDDLGGSPSQRVIWPLAQAEKSDIVKRGIFTGALEGLGKEQEPVAQYVGDLFTSLVTVILCSSTDGP